MGCSIDMYYSGMAAWYRVMIYFYKKLGEKYDIGAIVQIGNDNNCKKNLTESLPRLP